MPKGPRQEVIRRPKAGPRPTPVEQVVDEQAKLKANETARAAAAEKEEMEANARLEQAPYDDFSPAEGDMETSGDFRAAATEEGDVPSWDAADLKQSVVEGMGMAPELDTDQHRFGDPRALNMMRAVDVPVMDEKKKKQPRQKVDMKAMVLGTADIFDTQMEEAEEAAAVPAQKKLSAEEAWKAEKGLSSMIVDPELLQEAAQPEGKDIEKAAGPLLGGPAEEAALKQAVETEMAALPEEKKRRMLQGALNMGVHLTTLVNDGAALMADRLSRSCADSNSLYCRLALSTKTLFKTRADNTRRLLEGEDGVLSRKGFAKVASVYSWVRAATAIGTFGVWEIARRTSMAALGVAGTSLEVAKEARLKNMDLRERVGAERVKDMDVAAEEAWALYEEAKVSAKGKAPTAEQLSNKFGERLPKELLERLAKKPEGIAMGFAERLAERDLRRTLEKIQAKMDAIENGPGTDAEKRVRREQLMAGGVIAKQWGSYLKDADRFLTAAGTVDMLGYGARVAERTAKGARTALILLSLGSLAKRGWDAFSTHETFTPSEVGGESTQPEAIRSLPATGMDAEVMTAESRELPPGIVSMETVGAGGSITGSLMKQLEEHPEKFGYEGNVVRGSEQLHAWAFKTAKVMAKQAGFLTRKDQQDSWLSAAAIGKLHIGVDMSHGAPELAFVDHNGAVLSAADIKAGHYEMAVPFADKGEVPAEMVKTETRPLAPADYYANKVLGIDAGRLSSEEKARLGEQLARLKKMQADMVDPALSESTRTSMRETASLLVRDITKEHKGMLEKGWTARLEKATPYADVVHPPVSRLVVQPPQEEMGPPAPPREEERPHLPPVKPLRRPVQAPELEPTVDVAELSPDTQPLLPVFKGVLAAGFENLDAKGDISKETVLRLLDAVHKAKEGLRGLPPGDAMRRTLIADAQRNADLLNEIFGGMLKGDWFQKV